MARSVNKVILVGYVGKAAETRHTSSGTAVTNFDVATSRSVKDGQGGYTEQTEWHRCVVWKAESLAQYLTAGQRVFVEGRLKTRSWEDQAGNKRQTTQIVAEQVILLGGNGNSRGKTAQNDRQPQSSRPPAAQRRFVGGSQEGF